MLLVNWETLLLENIDGIHHWSHFKAGLFLIWAKINGRCSSRSLKIEFIRLPDIPAYRSSSRIWFCVAFPHSLVWVLSVLFLNLDIDIIWFLNLEIGRNELHRFGESLFWRSYCLSLVVTGFREMADFKAEVSLSLLELTGICFCSVRRFTWRM